jgi:hypothetical protein
MNDLGDLLESVNEDEILEVEFSDGVVFEYCGFEKVDKTIYGDDSYVVASLVKPDKGISLVEFQVKGIVKVTNKDSGDIVYERCKG